MKTVLRSIFLHQNVLCGGGSTGNLPMPQGAGSAKPNALRQASSDGSDIERFLLR